MFQPWMLPAALAVLCAGLLAKVLLLQHTARRLARDVSGWLERDTNTLLSSASRDRAMRRLAHQLNRELRLLRRERRRYQQGDQELKEAITNIAHDLRTPLTAIFGYLELLEGEETSPEAARYLALMANRAQALKQLTEELFRYSVVQTLPEPLHKENVNLNRAVEESAAAYYAALSAAGITPDITLPQVPVVRTLDRAAVSRVLGNILTNVVKYSNGDLSISLSESGELVFANTARGLDDVQVGRLFHRFYTVENGKNATGLGLSIAKTLVEQMGGTITAAYQAPRLCISIRFPAGETNP